MLEVGTRVRVDGLVARPDLNGAHATTEHAASEEEAADLTSRGRVKVLTVLGQESLSVKRESVTVTTDGEAAVCFSTDRFFVAPVPGRGHGLLARRAFAKGEVVLSERPLCVTNMMEHLEDPKLLEIVPQLSQFADESAGKLGYSEGALGIINQIAARVAELEFAKQSPRDQKRWMALHDGFAPMEPSSAVQKKAKKTAASIVRTNGFPESESRCHLYELISRINHSCAPNVTRRFDEKRGEADIVATRDIDAGEECCLALISEIGERATDERREMLRMKYNFECMCERCEPSVAAAERVPLPPPPPPKAAAVATQEAQSSGAPQEAWAATKARADEASRAGEWEVALRAYEQCLALLIEFAFDGADPASAQVASGGERPIAELAFFETAAPASAAHVGASLASFKLGNAEYSLKHADAALSIRPEWSQAHTRRGDALEALGRSSDAKKAYSEAERLDAESPS
jgi:tetratricopeptide (TPR) repeat protein